MDNITPSIERNTNSSNGSVRMSSPISGTRPTSLMDSHHSPSSHLHIVIVYKDDRGYGMKVSGDNPVYVQSVKEGGAAEKAGLHAGDKIIKVNGVNVTASTHKEVVNLIRASHQVVLTVQQRVTSGQRVVSSPSSVGRTHPSPSTTRITPPQPVDHEKQYQLQLEKEQHYRLMIEKEQRYIDLLRSQIASSPNEKKCSELMKTERNLQTLHAMLLRNKNEQSPPISDILSLNSPNGNTAASLPPPLPKRNYRHANNATVNRHQLTNDRTKDTNILFLKNEINANQQQVGGGVAVRLEDTQIIDNPLYSDQPPPLPPRIPLINPQSSGVELDAVNSINKQMSYPLVATCTAVNDNSSPTPTHQRTKSSPESLLNLSTVNTSNKLISSESLNDLTASTHQEDVGWDSSVTPPGTPPPPYPSPLNRKRLFNNENEDNVVDSVVSSGGCSSPDVSPFRNNTSRVLANSSPIHAATPQTVQQPIISMEDDEISDQEMNQLEDHGHFKNLSKLWEHTPHLAVFMNYILSNSDPNSLLFYLLTDLYKEGNAKEMRKWAFEIHSCFLVPGAPLRLSNVDENIAREIDDVLTKEFDKEEILRKIFWKARLRAKEELTKQLEHFQQKRTAGLGTIFGPTDQILSDIYNDKTKEIKLYESLFLEKLEPYIEDIEKSQYEPKRYFTAAALATVFTRIFGLRTPTNFIERCPLFVTKEKSFRTKIVGKNTKKLTIQGHQFIAQQYYVVMSCYHCHQIIYGIGPQGYQCSVCLINLHRNCVNLYEDSCPGPINKKDRGIRGLIRIRHDNDHRRKHNLQFIQMEKERRQVEDVTEFNENGDNKPSQPVTRSGSDRRPDSVKEETGKSQDNNIAASNQDPESNCNMASESTTSFPSSVYKKKTSSNINRSESVKEQSEKRKQRRNNSDPSHNTTTTTVPTSSSGEVDLDQTPFSNTDSGSSSNSSISYNGRCLSESPSNSVDAVVAGGIGISGDVDSTKNSQNASDSDIDMEPVNWQNFFPEEKLRNLLPHEKKRQDVISEFFHTEKTHVRNLNVLFKTFYKTLLKSQILKPDELNLIFPNIEEILNIHTQFSKEMKKKRREDPFVNNLGDLLINMFGGNFGEQLQKASATFCERQQIALEFIKERRKRDAKFDSILLECEKKPQCRRLPLQGIVPTEMQRLSKYPLLLERLISSSIEIIADSNITDETALQEDLLKLRKAHNYSKNILNYVNEAAKLALNHIRLEEIKKHLDTSNFERSEHPIVPEFRTIDICKYKLIIEGTMQLRRPGKALVPVHILLLEEAVIILHKEGDRFLLKFFQSGTSAQPQPLSPIIKMSTLLVRINAVCKNSLFLVSTSTNNSQMYDLLAEDDIKREIWFKHFTDAVDAYNTREGKTKRLETTPESGDDDGECETVQDFVPPLIRESERAETINSIHTNNNINSKDQQNINNTTNESEDEHFSDANDSERINETVTGEAFKTGNIGGSNNCGSGGGEECNNETKITANDWPTIQTKITADDWVLIKPSQVHIESPPVLTAESQLTPLEKIKRKDEEVRRALKEKEALVADLLCIPREHYQCIADMASEMSMLTMEIRDGDDNEKKSTITPNVNYSKTDLTEKILASIYQSDQLHLLVNDALNVGEADTIIASGGKHGTCQNQEILSNSNIKTNVSPSIPAFRVRDIATLLGCQLTTLLNDIKQVEEERDRLRKEVVHLRERLHEQHSLHLQHECFVSPTPSSEEPQDLDHNKDNPTKDEES